MMAARRCLLLVLAGLCWLCPGAAMAGAFSTVIIDPGHGGHDLGQKVDGVYEKWLALDVSLRLEKFLRAKGMKTVLTRRSDSFVPLPDRVKIADPYVGKSVFVSVHFNGSSNTGASGLETFYYNRSGYELAVRAHRRIVPALRGEDRGAKFARFHVIKNTRQPSILVEGGFLTNPAEGRRTLTGAYRQALACAIGQGILDYAAAVKSGVAR
jgi:N-acetylmuramoyl-L-alanine amidase